MATRPKSRCPDCKVLHEGLGRCKDCTPTRQQRGYDSNHDRLRAQWQNRLDQGEPVVCWRCDQAGHPHLVDPSYWHLGHDDYNRGLYRGPECPPGNQATAGRG
jgi:hypothetical protein